MDARFKPAESASRFSLHRVRVVGGKTSSISNNAEFSFGAFFASQTSFAFVPLTL